jgi:protein CpxP
MNGMKTLAVALVIIMVFAGSALAWGGGNHGKGGGKMAHSEFHGKGFGGGFMGFRILMSLDLTDAQKSSVANVIVKYRDEMKANKEKLVEAREKLTEAILAEEFNETAIRQAAQELAPLKEEMAVLRAKIASEIRPILTPDQIALFEERRAEKKERMKERIEAGCSRLDAWLESQTD